MNRRIYVANWHSRRTKGSPAGADSQRPATLRPVAPAVTIPDALAALPVSPFLLASAVRCSSGTSFDEGEEVGSPRRLSAVGRLAFGSHRGPQGG